VIMLGPGNEDACREACEAWPGHLQVGGGIKDENAREWIEKGASKVSVSDSSSFVLFSLSSPEEKTMDVGSL